MIAAILSTIEEKPEIISVRRTFAALEDVEHLPYQVEILGKNSLKIIVEGRKRNCYLCGTRGHMKTMSPV